MNRTSIFEYIPDPALLFRWNLHCRLQISTSFLHQMGTTFLCNFTKTSRNNAQCAKNPKNQKIISPKNLIWIFENFSAGAKPLRHL